MNALLLNSRGVEAGGAVKMCWKASSAVLEASGIRQFWTLLSVVRQMSALCAGR